MIVKCAFCDSELEEFYRPSQDIIIVYPNHQCNEMNLSFFDRVCTKCPSLIRCRRDGFECKEAWREPKGDWQGGHELYVRGDRS